MMDELSNLPNRDAQHDAPSRPSGAQPVTDREVPLVSATPFEAMHRWLDGEAREADALADPESARYVALWRRVGQETVIYVRNIYKYYVAYKLQLETLEARRAAASAHLPAKKAKLVKPPPERVERAP